nr:MULTISPECIES: leucine zipper domain-containing protein [Kocuria]
MTHVNASLTPTGRLCMVLRHLEDGILNAHVATGFRVTRPTVATWVARYLAGGAAGLMDRPSIPRRSSTRAPAASAATASDRPAAHAAGSRSAYNCTD